MLDLVIALGIVCSVAGATTFAYAAPRAGSTAMFGALFAVYGLASAGAVLRGARRGSLGWLRPRWGDVTRGVVAAAVGFALAVLATKLFVDGTPREGWLERAYAQLGDTDVLRRHPAAVACALFALAALEEITWRHLVTDLLRGRLGRRAWLGSAALACAAHLPALHVLRADAAGVNPVVPIAALALGLGAGALVRANGERVAPAVIGHAILAWCVFVMFRLWGASV